MSKKSYNSISEKYRIHGGADLSEPEVDAYLKARMPATFAAIYQVLKEVAERVPFPIESFLDLGAGPGTGLCAAKEVFHNLQRALLVEKNEHMIQRGKEIVEAEWVKEDLRDFIPGAHDLALFAYSFGEIPQSSQLQVLKKIWESSQVIIIIEPGTPRGFGHILTARSALIESQGHLIAPCPHVKQCPMKGGDWCHFAERLERSREHRQIKGAQLGWEDEKYSFVAFCKEPVRAAQSRILRHPQKHSGHVVLQLCTEEGVCERSISKKQGALYQIARKSKWGDGISTASPQTVE